MSAYSVGPWSVLFAASAGAAAALTGLLFVAVSINIERILKYPGVPQRALETLLVLLGVTVICVLGLEPQLSSTAYGIELLVAGGVLLVAVSLLIRSSLKARKPNEPLHIGSHLVTSVPGVIPFVIAGLSLLAGAGGGLNWALAGIVGAFIGASANAWVLLVEILR